MQAVMNLGSVAFAGTELTYAEDVACLDPAPPSASALALAAGLLGLPAAALLDGLARRVVRGGQRESIAAARTRRQVTDSYLTTCQCEGTTGEHMFPDDVVAITGP